VPLKPGARLRSVTDSTEVIVIRAPDAAMDLRCGGQPMVTPDSGGVLLDVDPDHASGTRLGKRYVDTADSVELLCTKAGPASLSVGPQPLTIRSPKPMPSSD
jgi:hypothetical protein